MNLKNKGKALEELAGDTLHEQKEDDYSDIILYDDDGTRVTNRDTLRAIRDSDRFIAEWERRHAG